MDEHSKYLADRLLSDQQPITYRLLSRAIDVHVNTAKEMLFDFHKQQNSVKPSSLHATYILYGVKARHGAQSDGDVEMSSSMPQSGYLSEDVPLTTMTLVAEEDLEGLLSSYQDIKSVHVYSLAPHPQRDLALLSEFSDAMAECSAKEDAVDAAKKYGTILNSRLRRRNRKGPANPPPAVVAPTQAKPSVKQEKPPAAAPAPAAQEIADASAKPSSTKPSVAPAPAPSSKKTAAPSLKRDGSGGIMQSFAKAAEKPPKAKKAAPVEDTAALSDDGEADEGDLPAPAKPRVDAEATRKARKDREEELRRMMEEDDEEEEEEEEEQPEPEDEEMDKKPPVEPTKPKEPEEPQEVVASTEDGRRRGKRKVMKKNRVVDDQGYMVTVQEQGWESFSEDEAPRPAKKATPASTPVSSSAKPKKPSAKGGQGNIMSFFGKK